MNTTDTIDHWHGTRRTDPYTRAAYATYTVAYDSWPDGRPCDRYTQEAEIDERDYRAFVLGACPAARAAVDRLSTWDSDWAQAQRSTDFGRYERHPHPTGARPKEPAGRVERAIADGWAAVRDPRLVAAEVNRMLAVEAPDA